MRYHAARYGFIFILIHWLLAVSSLALLGLGSYLHSSPTTTGLRAWFVSLHVSLGLSTAILVALALLIRLFFKAPAYPETLASWRRYISGAVHAFLYLSLILLLASGYLREVFAATPVEFWGTPLPIWGEADDELARTLSQMHQISAYVFAGFVLAHTALVIANSLRIPGFSARMLLFGGVRVETPLSLATNERDGSGVVRSLAKKLRILGWIEFWLQFILAFLCALLLQFATSGRMLSSISLGFGDAMYWGAVALGLLCVTCALSFYYTRQAKKVDLFPEYFFSAARKGGFWFLNIGVVLGFLGILMSFVGVALSILLLVAKTVSQPPGIAITDPTKIIRALDVFVLLMNFNLLIAHFVGCGLSLWLRIDALRARFHLLSSLTKPQEESAV